MNSKGYYHVSAIIDGKPAKRIINSKSELFAELQKYELGNLPTDETISLMESVFPPEEDVSEPLRPGR